MKPKLAQLRIVSKAATQSPAIGLQGKGDIGSDQKAHRISVAPQRSLWYHRTCGNPQKKSFSFLRNFLNIEEVHICTRAPTVKLAVG